MKPTATFHLLLPPSAADRFVSVWGAGVGIVAHAGISLMALLGDQLGIDRDYIDQRIQTIFVNGRAVDRMEQVTLAANAVVALSAAMPGLVGATFRKEGLLAGFRKDISHDPSATVKHSQKKTVITLKLFNLVAKELGPLLLSGQVWFKGRQLKDLLLNLSDKIEMEEGTVHWNGQAMSKEVLLNMSLPNEWVEVQIEFTL